MLLHEIDQHHCDVTRWSHHLHLTTNSYLASGCYSSQISLWLVKWKGVDRVTRSQTTLVTRVGNFILYAFCSSSPLCNVDKTLWFNANLRLTIFQYWKGNSGGAGTYSIGITVKSSCFCDFPPQFVHGCRYNWNNFLSLAWGAVEVNEIWT